MPFAIAKKNWKMSLYMNWMVRIGIRYPPLLEIWCFMFCHSRKQVRVVQPSLCWCFAHCHPWASCQVVCNRTPEGGVLRKSTDGFFFEISDGQQSSYKGYIFQKDYIYIYVIIIYVAVYDSWILNNWLMVKEPFPNWSPPGSLVGARMCYEMEIRSS